MSTDIYKFISHCSDCVQIKHEPPLKEKKNIIPKKPPERLQGDLTLEEIYSVTLFYCLSFEAFSRRLSFSCFYVRPLLLTYSRKVSKGLFFQKLQI